MNYKKVYNNIIERRKANPLNKNLYGEWHHIVPHSLNGTDEPDNLIKLSAREHFICHALLAEIYDEGTNEWYKMNHAFMMMNCSSIVHNGNRYFNSRLYEYKKKDFSKVMSKSQSGNKNSQYGTVWMYNLLLKKSKKILIDQIDSHKNNGWVVGRIMNWDSLFNKCLYCGIKFIQKNNEVLCSAQCKHKHQKKLREPNEIKYKIKKIAAKYNIVYGSIKNNKDFITECLDTKCTKNQICYFLKVNNSGANYKSIDKIYPRSSIG